MTNHTLPTEVALKPRHRALGFIVLLCLALSAMAQEEPFQTTAMGMEYKDLKTGSGAPAGTGDVATIHFVGWLDDQGTTGKELYNTRREKQPVSFVVGTDHVMPAWNDGVIGMQRGGKRMLKVPPELGYGAKGVQDVVPPHSRMIFIIELIDLQ